MANDITLVVRAKDMASGTFDKVQGKAGKLGGAIGGALRAGTMAGGVALAGLSVAVLKTGIDFDKAYDKIRIGTGATGDALLGLNEDFKKTLGRVPASMDDVSTAIADLNTRTGASGTLLQAMSAQMLEMTRLTGGDLNANIEGVTRVMGDWGVAQNDSIGLMDKLFTVSQSTGIGIDQLSRNLVQYGAPLRQLGFTIDESAALMGKFEKEGVNSELVMGSLRIALGKMAREGEPAIETFTRVTDQIKNAGSASEANALALELFGARAGPDMAAAIREGRFEVDELVASLANSRGAVNLTSNQTMSFGERFAILRNKLQLFIEPLATKLVTALTEGTKYLTAFFNGFSEGEDALEDWQGPMRDVIMAGIKAKEIFEDISDTMERDVIPALEDAAMFLKNEWLPVFITGLKTVYEAAKPLFEFIVNNKPALIAAITAIGIAIVIAFGPGAIAIAAIIGMITAIGLLKDNWQEIKDKISQIVDQLKTAIVDKFNDIITKIKEVPVIGEIIETTFNNVLTIAETIWGLIENRIQFYMDSIQAIIQIVSSLIKGDWEGAWNGVKDLFNAAWELIKSDIETAFGGIAGIIVNAFSGVAGVLGDIWTGIGGVVRSGINGVIYIINEALGFLEDRVNDVINNINSLDVFGVVPNIPNVSFGQIPSVGGGSARGGGRIERGRLQHGGIVTSPMLALIGEAGPEAVIPLNKAGGAGMGLTINFNGPLLGDERTAIEFANLIAPEIRRQAAI